MKRTNIIGQPTPPLNKDVRQYRRYSNAETTSSGTSTSGGSFDWGSFSTNLLNSATTLLGSIFGKSDKYKADAYETLYQQEQRTNTILWVVIGLVVALGVVLVIRKTK